ncbi:MAG: Geranylgeranyl pyrophosphate synthase [Candidatus Jorgensenbacteria bacterium GW2011_GWA1_48_11]|uniref:Geranylgeranyl pyrophosphate synthase n=1 Tax=Candidatus Jorgensenbacteria bacterium GW2011_GWA1_48_11 TaxID=1618660 RepID=A0A0G1UC95_9BACT|nr:MAG: Geranylgeranyl pyrophosphate synthase [Candidatus Jorgensenbacteria bacterium GW2011_GWA1_48_11]KKW12262.1 MAG: Geranylgeranyl pyrophosphate synthase [Candidatus Jorgensenbacteria bacterium GW2011_GWB1_49_9]
MLLYKFMETQTLYRTFDTRFEKEVLPYIEKKLPRDYFSEPIYYYIDNFQMRRFRAVLPLIIAEHTGVNYEDALALGAASELIFTIALVQDDFIDGDKMRGDILAAHEKYGAGRVLASADYAYGAVYDMISDLSRGDVPAAAFKTILEGFQKSHRDLYQSFIMELGFQFPTIEITKEYVRKVHLAKTAQGINALYCIGVLAEQKSAGKLSRIFKRYAELLGSAGQIKNDVYDFTRYAESRGLSDFRNGYITYPLAYLAEVVDRVHLSDILKKKDVDGFMDLMKEYNVVEILRKEINDLADQAISIIKEIPLPMPLKEILECWAEGNRFTR